MPHDDPPDDPPQKGWLPRWESDWSFEKRYQTNYKGALGYSKTITTDFCDAQEAVNDAFIELWKNVEMDPRLFLAILKNKSIDKIRKRIRRRKLGISEGELDHVSEEGKITRIFETLEDDTTPQPDEALIEKEREMKWKAFIEKLRAFLTPQQREIFDCKSKGLSDKEIAEKLGLTAEAVKHRWRRIGPILRMRFGPDFDALFS